MEIGFQGNISNFTYINNINRSRYGRHSFTNTKQYKRFTNPISAIWLFAGVFQPLALGQNQQMTTGNFFSKKVSLTFHANCLLRR